MRKENWAGQPAAKDFPAAKSYLSLVMDPRTAAATVRAMRRSSIETRRVNDVLRASRLPLLTSDDGEVAKNLKKVKKGVKLSPVLLVRGDPAVDRPLVIADGYHRVCASYHLDPDAPVHCVLVDLVAPSAPAARTRR